MRAYVNELALAQACAAAVPEQAPLVSLLEGRHRHPVLAKALFCARAMPSTPAREGLLLRDLGLRLPRDQRQLFFAWTAKQGPFIDDDRQPAELDLFVFGEDEIEVTDLGLGEAARRVLSRQAAAVLSPVEGPASRFAADPLVVVQGLRDEAQAHVPVPNFLDGRTLAEAVHAAQPEPTNWTEALAQARHRFDRLLIGSHCDATLSRETFKPHQSRRVSELFGVLQTLMEEMDEGGQLSAAGLRLLGEHFEGKMAWFSDESARNKQAPEQYTFPDPAGAGRLLCFWHGKVRSDAWRMHFEWPPADPAGPLKIAYIGPHRRS